MAVLGDPGGQRPVGTRHLVIGSDVQRGRHRSTRQLTGQDLAARRDRLSYGHADLDIDVVVAELGVVVDGGGRAGRAPARVSRAKATRIRV